MTTPFDSTAGEADKKRKRWAAGCVEVSGAFAIPRAVSVAEGDRAEGRSAAKEGGENRAVHTQGDGRWCVDG